MANSCSSVQIGGGAGANPRQEGGTDQRPQHSWREGTLRYAARRLGADWGWFAAAPNNSLVTVQDTLTQEIYALEWEAP